MGNAIEEIRRLGQVVWYDNIRRGLIESGELRRLIDLGVSGLTSNPTIFEKAIAGSSDYDDALLDLARQGKSVEEIYEALVMDDIRAAADLLRPVYDGTDGADGYASLEVSPHLAHDTEATVAEAERLFAAMGRPNVMIKVPATPEGIPAVRRLVGEGVNVNVTLTFSLEAYRKVREAYITGLEDLDRSGGGPSRVASVASFFVSRVDTAVDNLLEERVGEGRQEAKELLGKAAIANAKLAYRDFAQEFAAERFDALRGKGARVQRPLWASTSTKNPAYSDLLYVENLIGPDTVDTMPQATITALLEHGQPSQTLEQDVEGAELLFDSLEEIGISMEEVTAKLLAEGVKSFTDSYDELLANIEGKRDHLLAQDRAQPARDLGEYQPDVDATLEELQQRDVVPRIWRKDHTVWEQSPEEISNRLGWLDIASLMGGRIVSLEAFVGEVRDAGFRHVVLLGMGGSSLGPLVLGRTLGAGPDYPEFIVLDSTIPATVRHVTEAIRPDQTLFLVSSKSGGTVEALSLYKHFRDLVEQTVGKEHAGHCFVAITDEETPLEALAHGEQFRAVFLNQYDIGGRYSVLSYFGLVPAALMGLDLAKILDRAGSMMKACGPSALVRDNPGALLGAAMAVLALRGRDKLTLVASPSIDTFGLWVEQLIAESLGKEGRGIVPVVGEPLMGPEAYGDDRLFVYLRVEGDNNGANDDAMAEIEASGQPVVRLKLRDVYDLGSEFFRWMFATSVAGSILRVHPFDQPDVQRAKEETDIMLREYQRSGRLPGSEADSSIDGLLAQARPGDYLAVLSFLQPTPEVDRALTDLRRTVVERYRIATTLGYGPRYLHSTGQLHKGGPGTGLFVEFTSDHAEDVPIPGEPYTFGVLADAQASGDLRVLRERGRRVVRLHLESDGSAEIGRLSAELA